MSTIPFYQKLFPKKKPRTQGQPNPKKKKEEKQLVVDRLSGKITKEEANYRPVDGTRDKRVCFECEHYLNTGEAQGACRRVAGLVNAMDTCDLFVARQSEMAKEA